MSKILLVEDNPMNRDIIFRRLRLEGYDIVTANDGARGVAMAETERPDLILMDMSLPILDGWEATQQIKSLAALQSIPIIALTAHAMAEDRAKCLQAGCDEYESKPVEFPRLLAKIRSLLQQVE
jgi:CheY-like chemotaxis protein